MRKIGAAILGLLAVKLATYITTTLWRLILKENPPQADEPAPATKKLAWLAAQGVSTGIARQSARDVVKPAEAGPG